MGAKEPVSLIRFTVINKSEQKIGIRLVGIEDDELFYYLTIPEGDKENPAIKDFTITRAIYNMQVYYVATYDPVYGWPCVQPPPNTLVALRNLRLNFGPCGEAPPNLGEPSMLKFWPFIEPPQKIVRCGPVAIPRVIRCLAFRYIY
jgi:hypothetical protein